MSKKMKIPSIFRKEASQKWQWLSCKYPKTYSFRACNDVVFTTIVGGGVNEIPESSLMLERVISRCDRLFFEPNETSSIMKEVKTTPFKGSVAFTFDSNDPYLDFKKSMQEMVESQGAILENWEFLEELLRWYLRMNVKMNHGFIIEAFVDLLRGLDYSSKKMMMSRSNSTLYLSASSSFSSPSSPLSACSISRS